MIADQIWEFGGLRLDSVARMLTGRRREEIALRRSEYEVLLTFVRHPGRALSRDFLLESVAGRRSEPYDRSIDVLVGRLRRKIELDPKQPRLIVTVPGVGYRFAIQPHTGSLPPDSRAPPSVGPMPKYPGNLPQLPNPLIGRERDLVEVDTLLSRYRLVTLVGPPGVGKTSLALRMGADVVARFPDGAWFVELAPLDRAELVAEAVAAVFGLPVLGQRPAADAIASFLRSKRVLLILDNCEHVIAAAAELADTLVKTCPNVSLLASSRETLSVPGEHAYPVPSLDVPPQSMSLTAAQVVEHSAVQLFIARASQPSEDSR